jgi:hypothetical protein
MAESGTPFRHLTIFDGTPSGSAGAALNTNFEVIAANSPLNNWEATSAPNGSETEAEGWYAGAMMIVNGSTLYIKVSEGEGEDEAVWRQVVLLNADGEVELERVILTPVAVAEVGTPADGELVVVDHGDGLRTAVLGDNATAGGIKLVQGKQVAVSAVEGTVTIDCRKGTDFIVTVTGNDAIAFTNAYAGWKGTVTVIQGADGPHTPTFTSVTAGGELVVDWLEAEGDRDIYLLLYTGSTMVAVARTYLEA